MQMGDKRLSVTLFEQFPIRRTWHADEWWYSCVDTIAALTASSNAARYWTDLKKKLEEMGATLEDFVSRLPMPNADQRMRKTDCANMAGLLRIVQSVASPNAEPFKRWLADLGAAELEELQRADYRLKLHRFEQELFQLVRYRGIVTPEEKQKLTDANYRGLYDGMDEYRVGVVHQNSYAGKPPDFMGSQELGIHIFQRTQTAYQVREHNLQGIPAITTAAEFVGREIRHTLERMGSPMPETLPRFRLLSRGEWVPAAELSEIDWDAPAEDDDPPPSVPLIEIPRPPEEAGTDEEQ